MGLPEMNLIGRQELSEGVGHLALSHQLHPGRAVEGTQRRVDSRGLVAAQP